MKQFFIALAALSLLFACTPEANKPSGTDEPEGGKDKTVHVTGIQLNPTSTTIKEGESVTLVATVTPSNADNKAVRWSSSSDAVAKVDANGKVTGVKTGSATITATAEDGGMKATCALSVEANFAPSVTIGVDYVTAISVVLRGKANLGTTAASDLQIGFQYSKSAGIMPSNSTTVVGEDADANYNYTSNVTGLEPATTYYFRSFVRQNGQDTYGETKEFTTKDVASLLETKDASAVEATRALLNAKLDLTDVHYKSLAYGFLWGTSESALNTEVKCTEIKDNAISAVLTNLSNGTQYWYKAYVQFASQTLYGEVKTFTTPQWVTSISLSKTSLSLLIGEEETISVTSILPDNAYDKSITWSSSNNAIASVDQNGKITAKAGGNTVIKATANDGSGVFASCAVRVGGPITIDGKFGDWAMLDGTKIATATTDPEANHTALKVVKVYADEYFVFVYFEWDKEQIEWELDVEHVPFHIYINGDGKADTGGFGNQWSDACMDTCFEGFLTDGNDIASYDPGVYAWTGEANGTGWSWEDLGPIDGICSGAGIEGKYEIQIVRELYPFKPLADNFSIGFDIQQGWNSVGVLPNTAVTDENPGGIAPSLQVKTVK